MAQEFHISVTPLGDDEYFLVRIERVAPGVPLAEEQVRWPMEDWLVQARQLMNDPVMGLLQGDGALAEDIFPLSEWDEPASPYSRNLVELGEKLYNALFYGSLRDSWMMAQAIAQNQGKILRLRLGLKGTRLPRLPWEVLHAGDRPLATGTDVAFSRYQLSTGLWNPRQAFSLPPNQRLKILMVVASPDDQETLKLAQEANDLKQELERSNRIQIELLEHPGREELTQKLEQGQYQVFHYSGHSNQGESGGDVYLINQRTGLTEPLNGNDLAGLLVNNGVQLAVFNSCRGAYTAPSSGLENGKERNLAEALVKRGIPAVLAMAERIPDEVALTLTRLLYRNLDRGYPIDLSLSRARQGLVSAYGSNQFYWALPVLYLNPQFNGFLTKDTPQNQEELFALPEPPDIPLPRLNEEPFSPPIIRSISFSADGEDESDDFLRSLDSDDPDGDDPSVFIKDLLSQLSPEAANGESVLPATEAENQSATEPDVASWKLGGNPANPTPSPAREPATSPSARTPGVSSPQTDKPINPPQAQRRRKSVGSQNRRFRTNPKLWMILGAIGALALALLGFWLFQNRALGPGESLPEISSSTPVLPQTTPSSQTATVTNEASEQFKQGNIAAGQKAVEALLDQGSLPQARAVLDNVPEDKRDNPAVYFLKGRLAWQFIQSGSKDYDVTDARRFWEWASKKQPNSLTYLNALGFAYYTEGNYNRAYDAWQKALSLIEKAPVNPGAAGDTAKREALNTYAGLALVVRQSVPKLRADKQAKALKALNGYRQVVMTTDPVNFQPDALSKNWLWTEKAIQDWRSLLSTNQ